MTTIETNWDQLLKDLAETSIQVAIVCTGGGSGAISRCFRRAGASRNFIEGVIPYSKAASEAYLGSAAVGSRASKAFAQQLASVAFDRAKQLSDTASPLAVGIALVAALPTVPASSVEERIQVAMHRKEDQECWSKTLEKGVHTRESAESVADEMIYRALLQLVCH